MISVGEKGSKQAAAITKFLAGIPNGPQGIVHRGSTEGGVSDAEKIEYQRDGIQRTDGVVVRDITPTEDDAHDAGLALMARYRERLAVLTKGGANPAGAAAAASASGLKEAHKIIRDRMRERIEKGQNSDGSGMRELTKRYADWRYRKYNVPATAFFRRTGRLIASLNGPGHLVYKAP